MESVDVDRSFAKLKETLHLKETAIAGPIFFWKGPDTIEVHPESQT